MQRAQSLRRTRQELEPGRVGEVMRSTTRVPSGRARPSRPGVMTAGGRDALDRLGGAVAGQQLGQHHLAAARSHEVGADHLVDACSRRP